MTKNFLFLVFAVHFLCFAPARHESHFEENPKTILWKISGNGLKKPSYLLGTHHLVDSTWLFQFPKIKAAIDNSEFLLNEAFSTDGFETLEQRNRYWLPKIENHIAGKSCLIAVGFGHLKYKTGVIVLLRQRGYRVEAVL